MVAKWSVTSTKPFVYISPQGDGSVLATTRDDVVSIDASGAQTLLYDGPESAPPSLVLAEGVKGFGVRAGGSIVLHDASGAKKASVPLEPLEYARLIPGSLRTFVPRAESIDGEHGRMLEGRVFDESGKLGAKFAATGLRQSRTSNDYVVWATGKQLTKTKLAGGDVWSLPIMVQRFEIDQQARFGIVNRAGDTRVVELFDEDKLLTKTTFDRPIWNLAISPEGKYAAANSKTTVRLFASGKLAKTWTLGSVYPVSLDVSDLGYVLVGVQDLQKHMSSVLLYDAGGALKWSQTFGVDHNAHRPEVRFGPDGAAFLVRTKQELSYFVMEAP